MGLSEWPDKFTRRDKPDQKFVTVDLDESLFVKIVTDKAVGLSCDRFGEVEIWIPLSQLPEDVIEQGERISTILVSQWFADQRGWDYQLD